jgi:4-hydroxybenzoate-CoA ligase
MKPCWKPQSSGTRIRTALLKPKAYVVLKQGFAHPAMQLFESLKAHVKDKAGAWKYPRWIDVRADLPKTATGKIQRFKLREEDAVALPKSLEIQE